MGFIDTRNIRLREGLWFEPRREWTQLTHSGALGVDVTFAEFLAALKSIQQDFARLSDSDFARAPGGVSNLRTLLKQGTRCHSVAQMGDREVTQAIRDAVERQRLVAWPEDRAIRERIAEMRALDAAARYWAKAVPAKTAPTPPKTRTETLTPSQLYKNKTIQDSNNGSKAARWRTRKNRIANARKQAREHHLPRLQEAADRFERNNTAVEQAKLAEHVYHLKQPAPEGWRNVSTDSAALAKYGLKPKYLSIPDTDFRVGVYQPDPDIFGSDMKPQIVFKGTDKLSKTDWSNNVSQAMNEQSDYYERAVKIGQKLKRSISPIDIDGHSLGGGLASVASIVSGQHAATFNPAGLHPATLERYGAYPERVMDIDRYTVEGDALTVAQSASFGLLPDAVHTRHYLLPGHGGPLERHDIQSVIDGFETQKREDQAYIVEALAK